MNKSVWKKRTFLLSFMFIISLTSCNRGEKEDKTTIISLAVFEDNSLIQQEVVKFNKANSDFQIKIKNYNDLGLSGSDAVTSLKREIMTKNGPDIISFGKSYSNSSIAGNYLEDLYPFIKNDLDIQEENYFNNILEAYDIGDKLYAIPISFTLQTMTGLTSQIGSKSGWNINEIMECYKSKKDKMILYPGETQRDVFGTICTASMEHYINWETGECQFDSQEFKDVLEFCNQFPDKLQITEDFSVKSLFLEGKALLLPTSLNVVYDMAVTKNIFGNNEVTYIGYPVDGVNGTIINSADMILGISTNSQNKLVAWEFIKQFLEKDFQENIEDSLPIYKEVVSEKIKQASVISYTTDEQGNKIAEPKAYEKFEGEDPIPVYNIDQQDGQKLMELIELAAVNGDYDYELYNIILEEADAFFVGDKTLEEITSNIQNRVSIYVKERIG